MHVDAQFSVSLHATLKSKQLIIRSFTMNMTINLIDLISYDVSKVLQQILEQLQLQMYAIMLYSSFMIHTSHCPVDGR